MSIITQSRAFLSLSADRARTLRSNFAWNAAGNGVFALCQWGILIVFAKLGSPALVGQVVYGLALTAPLFVIAQLQLRSVQSTDATRRHTLSQYVGLRVITTIAALIITSLVASVMCTGNKPLCLIVLLWALTKAVDSGSDCLYGLFQQAERMDYVGVSFSLRGVLSLASVAILFRASHSAALGLAGLAISWGAVFILFDIPMARNLVRTRNHLAHAAGLMAETLCPVLDRRQLTQLSLEAAPLGIVAFLLTIQIQIPRYVVAGVLHTRELGLFSAAAYLTFTGALLVNALGAPAMVRLAKYHVTDERSAFLQLLTKLCLVATVLGVAGILASMLFGRRILAVLYTSEYSRMAGVLTILCAGSALTFIASFLGYAMTAQGRYKIQVPIGVYVTSITLVSCYFLTMHYGLTGTALGVLIGNLAQLLICVGVVWHGTRTHARCTVSSLSAAIGAAESKP